MLYNYLLIHASESSVTDGPALLCYCISIIVYDSTGDRNSLYSMLSPDLSCHNSDCVKSLAYQNHHIPCSRYYKDKSIIIICKIAVNCMSIKTESGFINVIPMHFKHFCQNHASCVTPSEKNIFSFL